MIPKPMMMSPVPTGVNPQLTGPKPDALSPLVAVSTTPTRLPKAASAGENPASMIEMC